MFGHYTEKIWSAALESLADFIAKERVDDDAIARRMELS